MKKAAFTLFAFVYVLQLRSQNVPLLTSLPVEPGRTAVILLDFDGYMMETGSSWAVFANSGNSYYTEPSGLTAADINLVFHIVAQDFRPFAVAVTTDSNIYAAAPIEKRLRIVFTSTHQWYRYVAGVAFRNSIFFADDTPVWVFSAIVRDAKTCGDVASHEAGHALGLVHHSTYDENCNVFDEYDPGSAAGSISWAPIMGSVYYTNLSTWDNGDSVKPLSCQSRLRYDIEEISSVFTMVNDDVDENTKNIPVERTTHSIKFRQQGTITSRGDQDKFSFTLTDSVSLTITIQSPYVSAGWPFVNNADLKVILSDEAGNTTVYAPFRKVGVEIKRDFTPGTYYLVVAGDGNEWMSNYGSLGDYVIVGEGLREDVDLWVDLGPDTVLCDRYLTTMNYYLKGDREQNPPGTIYYWSTGEDYDPIIMIDRPGVYWVRAENPKTKTKIATDTVVVMISPSIKPELSVVEYDRSACESRVTFKDMSVADCIEISRISLDFGDGDSTGLQPHAEVTHRYIEAGNYTVRMVVYDINDSSYEYLHDLRINEPAARPQNPLGDDVTVCEGALYTLAVDIPYSHYTWADGYDNEYREVTPGTYIVIGDLYDPFTGKSRYCSFTDTITITSTPHIIPEFQVKHDGIGTIILENKTTTCDNNTPWYHWSLGQYGETDAESPSIKLSASGGKIPVTLTVFTYSDTATLSRELGSQWLSGNQITTRVGSVYSKKIHDGKGKIVVVKNTRRPVIVNSTSIVVDYDKANRTQYRILGTNGQLYAAGQLLMGTNIINTSLLRPGLYILQMGGKANEAVKFVRK